MKRTTKAATVNDIKEAIMALALKRGTLSTQPAEYVAGALDALTWVMGEPGRSIAGMPVDPPQLDPAPAVETVAGA